MLTIVISDDDHDMELIEDEQSTSNTKRVIDMSEAVYMQIPLNIVSLLKQNNSEGLKYFQVTPNRIISPNMNIFIFKYVFRIHQGLIW